MNQNEYTGQSMINGLRKMKEKNIVRVFLRTFSNPKNAIYRKFYADYRKPRKHGPHELSMLQTELKTSSHRSTLLGRYFSL